MSSRLLGPDNCLKDSMNNSFLQSRKSLVDDATLFFFFCSGKSFVMHLNSPNTPGCIYTVALSYCFCYGLKISSSSFLFKSTVSR